METNLIISCLQSDWSVETTNTPAELSAAFFEAAQAHADRHEQHVIEIVQRLKVYSATMSNRRHPAKTRSHPRLGATYLCTINWIHHTDVNYRRT